MSEVDTLKNEVYNLCVCVGGGSITVCVRMRGCAFKSRYASIRVCIIVQVSLRRSLHDAELKQSQLALNRKESELEV